jgi:hypothetical protein
MRTILTHFHLDSIFHSGFDGIAMLPERNQSYEKAGHQRGTQELRKPLSIPARRLSPPFTANTVQRTAIQVAEPAQADR